MPQYSNTITAPSGLVTTAVLNPESQTITYTMTAPNGATATTTQSSTLSGSYSLNITRLANQLAAGGYNANRIEIVSGARDTTTAVKQQAAEAQTAATATDTPVPAAPAPPAPTNNTADPAVPPVPVAPVVENTAPAPVPAVVETPPATPLVENAVPAAVSTIPDPDQHLSNRNSRISRDNHCDDITSSRSSSCFEYYP